jgi:hypothetical protein
MQRRVAFTMVELLVVLVVIVVVIAVLLPATSPRRPAYQMQNLTQLRGIHQGYVLVSQDNHGYYAGFTRDGVLAPAIVPSPEAPYGADQKLGAWSMAVLLNGNYLTPAYLINPKETNRSIKPVGQSGMVTSMNYSYAVSKAVEPATDKGRIAEWRDNTNPQAVVLSDRVLKSGVEPAPGEAVPPRLQRSTWTKRDGDWRGGVVLGDNSALFLTRSTLASTKYGEIVNTDDNLFTRSGPDDAFQFRN